MKDESKKFPAVMTLVDILGIEEGIVLNFDWASGKYVSVSEEEDIAEEYFYSGYALALDPYLVKDNIGTFFTFIEQESEALVDEDDQPYTKVVTKEDVDLNPGEDLKEGDVVTFPEEEYTKVHNLVVDCDCGHRHMIGTMQAPGVQFTIMAEDENSFIELTCPECGSVMKLWFATDIAPIDESTEKESN